MCKSKGRHIFIGICKLCQFCNDIDQFLAHQKKCITHDDNIGVITYIAGSRSQMDDACCLRALFAICVDMAHNIMANLCLSFLCHIIIDVVDMCFHLIDHILCDDRLAVLAQS